MLDEVIKKYRIAFKTIEVSQNPKTHLFVILEFFRFIEKCKLNHLTAHFLNDFITPLINLFKHTNIEFLTPDSLISARFLIHKSILLTENEIIKNELKSILYQLNIRLLVTYYYLGEAENGKLILEDLINSNYISETGFRINDDYIEKRIKTSRAPAYSLVDPNIFKRNIIFDILHKINYELKRINAFSNDSVNILMVESETVAGNTWSFGSIMEFNCEIESIMNINKTPLIIDNITDINDSNILNTKDIIWNTAKTILKTFKIIINESRTTIHLRFKNLSGIYKGTSFGLGAIILIPAKILNYLGARKKYRIACAAAFTGSVDENGNFVSLPDEIIKYKVEAAFFSWVKYIVIPKENYNAAHETVQSLKNKYPRKELNIIAENNVYDIFPDRKVVEIHKDSFLKHASNVLKKHPYFTYSILSIIIIISSILIAKELIPRNIKPLPNSSNYLNLYYTPDRDTTWIFQNSDRAGGDTINFGEIAVGDMLTHRISLWNNADDKKPIRFELHGRDKDEFEIIWAVDQLQKLTPEFTLNDKRQRIYLKFVPYKSTGIKEAVLKVFDSDNPQNYKIIHLKGTSGLFRSGYSLNMKNDDEYIVNPKLGNFLGNNFTIMLWFKPNKESINILNDDNSNWTDTKFSLTVYNDSTLRLHILEAGAKNAYTNIINSKNKVKLNDWNFGAFSHNSNITYLYLNDEVLKLETEKEHFKQMEDFFYLGPSQHPVKRTSFDFRKDNWELNIAEFKIFNSALNGHDIRIEQYRQTYYEDDRLRLYHNFEETVGHYIFDRSRNDIPGELYGLTQKSLDYPQVKRYYTPGQFTSTNNKYIKVKNRGEIRLNKNVFASNTSFTIQFEAKAGGNLKREWRQFIHASGTDNNYTFNFVKGTEIRIAREDLINDASFELAQIPYLLDTNWHKYTFDYSYESNTGRLFVDGKLISEYSLGKDKFDIAREFYCMIIGKEGQYDNPRWFGEECSVDNVALFNRTLNQDEINFTSTETIKSIPGLLSYWTFSEINHNISYDEISQIPVFIWEEYDVMQRN
jgi:hypothetical protein